MSSICVFCGAHSGTNPVDVRTAELLGQLLAESGHTLIYGGGSTGIMGALADKCIEYGGNIIGVIPEALANVELMHTSVADMRVVPDMHTRKATMHELSDAYIALPGGYGTMEELFEAICWAQLSFHRSPVVLFNSDGLYDGLITMVDHMLERGFLNSTSRELLDVVSAFEELRDWIQVRFESSDSAVRG